MAGLSVFFAKKGLGPLGVKEMKIMSFSLRVVCG